jgi:hypothetical protein
VNASLITGLSEPYGIAIPSVSVPEPGSLLLFVSALLGLGALSFRKRKSGRVLAQAAGRGDLLSNL